MTLSDSTDFGWIRSGAAGRLNALLFAPLAGPLLALEDAHIILSRTYVEHFGLFVADDGGLLAALAADALAGGAGDGLLDALQMAGKLVAARGACAVAYRPAVARLNSALFSFGNGSRWLSASTSSLDTPGSRSSSSS